MGRPMMVLCLAATLGLVACSGSDETDGTVPIGAINGPAVVDPSFDPFATDPSAPPVTGRD